MFFLALNLQCVVVSEFSRVKKLTVASVAKQAKRPCERLHLQPPQVQSPGLQDHLPVHGRATTLPQSRGGESCNHLFIQTN